MLRVPIIRARPGMELALDVLHPVSGQRLLSRGFPLDAHLIAKLRELRVHEVWVRYPAAEEICRYVAPAVLEHHARLVGLVADLFGSMHSRAHADLDFVPYREALGGMIESLAQHDDAAIYLVEMGGGNGSSLRHAIETCFLSVLLGVRLRDYLVHQRKRLSVGAATDITPLALGALLIDLGMDHIDPTVRARWERTGDEGDPRFREHVQLGYRLLSGRIPPSAAAVVLTTTSDSTAAASRRGPSSTTPPDRRSRGSPDGRSTSSPASPRWRIDSTGCAIPTTGISFPACACSIGCSVARSPRATTPRCSAPWSPSCRHSPRARSCA